MSVFSRINGDIWHFIYMSEMVSTKMLVTVTAAENQERLINLKDQLKKNTQLKNWDIKYFTWQILDFVC